MDIEEAKNKLIEWVDDDRVLRDDSTDSDFDRFCEEKNIAIETVLAELDKRKELDEICAHDNYVKERDKFRKQYEEHIKRLKGSEVEE